MYIIYKIIQELEIIIDIESHIIATEDLTDKYLLIALWRIIQIKKSHSPYPSCIKATKNFKKYQTYLLKT